MKRIEKGSLCHCRYLRWKKIDHSEKGWLSCVTEFSYSFIYFCLAKPRTGNLVHSLYYTVLEKEICSRCLKKRLGVDGEFLCMLHLTSFNTG